MRVTIKEVEKIASLSMLTFTEQQKEEMQKNLDAILSHAEKLNELDTTDVEPTSYILKQQNVLRDDVPGRLWEKQKMLQNAPEKEDGYFAVPKVVE